MSSSSKAPGLGERQGVSTRPTREERRREVERVQAAPPADDTATAAQEASQAAALTKIAPRKKPSKVPFNTYITASTQQRIEWLKGRGYAVTDIAEEALREFLDRAGVPANDSAGERHAT